MNKANDMTMRRELQSSTSHLPRLYSRAAVIHGPVVPPPLRMGVKSLLTSRSASKSPSLKTFSKRRSKKGCIHFHKSVGSSADRREKSAKTFDTRDSKSLTMRPTKISPWPVMKSPDTSTASFARRQTSLEQPFSSVEAYEKVKEKLLHGKFKMEMTNYLGLETLSRLGFLEGSSSDDDDYDTDLDSNSGRELLAEERSNAILEEGTFLEYKHQCRKLLITPNSYFLRHSLGESLQMRHRYLSPGDCKAMTTHIKNHVTMSKLDVEDNAVGPIGVLGFQNMLQDSNVLTELNLAHNCLGSAGAKALRDALVCNASLVRLDVSGMDLQAHVGNSFGDRGGIFCAEIIEDNIEMKEFIVSENGIGDAAAVHIAKALVYNRSLVTLDLSWNCISGEGGVKLAEGLKKNATLENMHIGTNGLAEAGGKAMISALRKNASLKTLDLSNNRINEAVIKHLSESLSYINGLRVLKLQRNIFSSECALDLLANLQASKTSIKNLAIDVVGSTDQLIGIIRELFTTKNVYVTLRVPPSRRERTNDILTRNLMTLAQFFKANNIDFEDIYCSYDDGDITLSTDDVLRDLQRSGVVTNMETIRSLKSKLYKPRTKRRFQLSELALVMQQVKEGRDPRREMPLRTHLRRSIKKEREEEETM